MREGDVITLGIMHGSPHAVVAFAEAQVIGGVILGWLALAPVPAPPILDIDDINGVILHNRAILLQAQVVHAGNALFKNLRAHDGAAH